MRYRQILPVFQLTSKQRNHRTVRSQYVSKPRSYKLRLPLGRHHLHQHLGRTFGSPHHVGRVHRLIRRDKYKFLRLVLHRHLRHHPRTFHIHPHRFFRVGLHHRHMLVRCCMKHRIGLIQLKHLFHPVRTRHIPHHKHHVILVVLRLTQLQHHIVHRRLSVVHHDQ